ncbi:Uma2 family endonuclease [Bdellovibrionota bacterium FG-2]
MNSTARKLATYNDLFTLPDNVVGEIIAGELIASPRPGPRHARASTSLGGALDGPFDRGHGGPGGWWILDEPELHLGQDVLVPDLAGWKREKLPNIPVNKAYFDVAPNWVCEVLSNRTAGLDRVKKLPIYAREKVDHVWLIDPDKKTLEIYARDGEKWLLLNSCAGNERIRAAPFDAIEIDLGALWLPDEQ